MPLVSAIIPAYNGASRFLEQAIRSVLSQTFRDLELIVVDDASTDDTGRLVCRFPQAHYLRRAENAGQAAARNDGALRSTGKFLAFLDQDDLWEPTFLQETLDAAKSHPDAAVIHADGFQVTEHNDILEYDAAMKHTDSITQLLRGGHDTATSGSLFRKTCFEAVGGYDVRLTIWEDIDLAIRLFQRFPLVHLAKPLYRHRLYDRNVSRGIPSERALQARRYFLEKHGPRCAPGSPEARALRKDWGLYYGDLGKYLLRSGQPEEARRCLWRSVKHLPLSRKAWLRLGRSFLAPSLSADPGH
jgi:glycosyltransferase involved in cell wall biosynthesis